MEYYTIKKKVELLNKYMKHLHMSGGCTEKTFMHFEYMLHTQGYMPHGIYKTLYEQFDKTD